MPRLTGGGGGHHQCSTQISPGGSPLPPPPQGEKGQAHQEVGRLQEPRPRGADGLAAVGPFPRHWLIDREILCPTTVVAALDSNPTNRSSAESDKKSWRDHQFMSIEREWSGLMLAYTALVTWATSRCCIAPAVIHLYR